MAVETSEKQIEIPKEALLETAHRLLGDGFDNLHCITAVDKIQELELIYIFYSMDKHDCVILKTRLVLNDLTVESLAKIWKSADWLEREVYDLFGVKFLNHPDLKRILNPDDWDVHPLRKDFSRPDIIKKLRY